MPKFKIAHVKDQGVNIIIVPLTAAFGSLPDEEKERVIEVLQACAVANAFNGRVVPVWFDGKRMRFIAPPVWHGYFQKMKMQVVRDHLNRELDTDDVPAELDPHEVWPSEKPPVPLGKRIAQIFGFAK